MKSAKTIVIVAAVLFAALSFSSVSAEREPQPTEPARAARTPVRPAPIAEEEAPRPRPVTRTPARTTPTRTPSRRTPAKTDIARRILPIDPYKETVIMLEAFMVEVKISALHSQGLPAISKGDDHVTADHIIKLMKTTDAAVLTASAKLALTHENKAKTNSRTRQSILSGEQEKQQRVYVEVGTTFTAFATIRAGQKIYLDTEFEHSSIEKGDGKTDTEVFVEREWTSSVTLQEGKPALIGAIADKETGTFLIVTAHIKD